jgi:hypothetical protein
MNWEERKEKLIKMYDNYCMNDFFTKIVTQEQAIVEQLEADKAELLRAVKSMVFDRLTYGEIFNLIQKMEVK